MNIDEHIQIAVEHLKSGKLQQAENVCRKILRQHPNNIEGLHFLGIICYKMENYDCAVESLEKALLLDPENSELYHNLGIILTKQGKIDEAILCYQKALRYNPYFSKAYYNLGTAFQGKGQYDEATIFYNKALQIDSNLPSAYYNLGIISQEKHKLDEAINYYQKAIQNSADFYAAYNNMGMIYYEKGQIDKAIESFKKALQINPNFSEAYYNLANTIKDKGEFDKAVSYYQQALQLNPDYVDAYNNLGLALAEIDKYDEAITCFQKVIKLCPEFVKAYSNLGIILHKIGKIDEALHVCNEAISINPDYITAHWLKCMFRLPIIYQEQSDIEIARRRYHDDLVKLDNMITLDTPENIEEATKAVGSRQPFYLSHQGMNNRELQQIYGNIVCRIMAKRYPDFASKPLMPSLSHGEPIRVGVVSGYFYYHSAWKMPIKGWIENIDRSRFSLYGYYTASKKDEATEAAKQCFYRFVEDIYDFERLCEIIREDDLHILVFPEISQDPTTLKLASLWLAPVQCVSALGATATSGLKTIDYALSSNLMEPDDADNHYTEQLIRLPNLLIYQTPEDIPQTSFERDKFGIKQKSIIYLCCHQLPTHLPQYDEIYPRIAKEIEDCQFIFLESHFSSFITDQYRLRLRQAFTRFNLNYEDYVVFLPLLDKQEYRAINYISDIFLDTIGWSACNSAFEAIACDLPIITLPGEFMRGRHTSAILNMMGINETIAKNPDEYIEIAVRLGQDGEWRKLVSSKIADTKHRVYRDKTCITALEDFFERIVKEKLR